MTDKELKDKYPNWLYIESPASKIYLELRKYLGENCIEENHTRIFGKYIDKYFSTWDSLAYHMSGDYSFSPVVFCLFAENKGIKPTQPIKIMRRVLYEFSKISYGNI